MRMVRVILICLFATLTPVLAQDNMRERVLLPVWSNQPLAGAFGSLWKTELAIVNQGGAAVQIDTYDYGCLLATCAPTPPTPPNINFSPVLKSVPTEMQGFFLYVARPGSPDVHFELRVMDLTR